MTRVEDTHWDTFCHEQSSFQLGKGPPEEASPDLALSSLAVLFPVGRRPGPSAGRHGPHLRTEGRRQEADWAQRPGHRPRVGKRVLAQLLASEVHPQSHPAGRWEDSDSHCRQGARDAGWPEPDLKQLTVYVSSCCLSASHTGCLLPQECTFLMAKQTPPKTHSKNTKGKLKIKSGHQKLK